MRDRSQLVLPMELGIKIAENDPVRKLIEICEELDYTKLYETYVRTWRKVSGSSAKIRNTVAILQENWYNISNPQ